MDLFRRHECLNKEVMEKLRYIEKNLDRVLSNESGLVINNHNSFSLLDKRLDTIEALLIKCTNKKAKPIKLKKRKYTKKAKNESNIINTSHAN